MSTSVIWDCLSISHNLGPRSLISVYAPTGVSKFSVKESLYAQLQKVDSRIERDTLIVLVNLSATIGIEITDKNVYQSRVGPHCSGLRDESSFLLLDYEDIGN